MFMDLVVKDNFKTIERLHKECDERVAFKYPKRNKKVK